MLCGDFAAECAHKKVNKNNRLSCNALTTNQGAGVRISPGAPFIEEEPIRPYKNDYIVWKGNWTNGYRDTDLRTILHALKIRRLVIAGIAEPACVYGTFLGTFDEGIEPIMLSDCLVPAGSDEQMANKVHDFSIKTFYPMMGSRVITSKELVFIK
jgi:nicotinamidase-related amidase